MEMQRGVLGDLATMPQLAEIARDAGVIKTCAKLVAGAREASVPVVHATVSWRSDRLGTSLNTPLTSALARNPSQILEGTEAVAQWAIQEHAALRVPVSVLVEQLRTRLGDVLRRFVDDEGGYVLMPNVNPITEMVDMITTLRSYESSQRVITSIDGTLDKAVNSVGSLG